MTLLRICILFKVLTIPNEEFRYSPLRIIVQEKKHIYLMNLYKFLFPSSWLNELQNLVFKAEMQ